MSIFIISVYFSLMFSIISIIRLIPFSRTMRYTLILRSLLCISNILSVLYLIETVNIVSLIILALTIIFTEGSEYLKKYIKGHSIELIQSSSILLKLNLALSFSTDSFGFLELSKVAKCFKRGDDKKAMNILSAFNERVKFDLLWISTSIIFLLDMKREKTAYSLLETVSVDLRRKNIPYQFLQIAIHLYCDNQEFDLAELYLAYMETNYYDAQHKYSNLSSYLYYYAKCGNQHLFNELTEAFPSIKKNPSFPILQDIVSNAHEQSRKYHIPQSYQFTITSGGSVKTYPLYVFAGIISVISIIVLFLSAGGSLGERILSGQIYPIEYIKYGALMKDLILGGEFIRLITPIFLHGGLLHLALNVFGLINVGRILVRFFDKYILLFIFAGGALAGNLLSIFFSSANLSVGASGGVFSILGSLFIYLMVHRREINKISFHRILVNFAVILVIQILFGVQNPNIDNFAHLGGFLGGMLLTVLSLWIGGTVFQKYYVFVINFILFLGSIGLLVFWSSAFWGSSRDKFPLKESVVEPTIEYSIPEFWEKSSDRYYDILSGAQVLIEAYDGEYEIKEQIETIKGIYSGKDNFQFLREKILDNGWTSLEFNSSDQSSPYSLYYFCRDLDSKFADMYLFLDPEIYDDYLPVLESVMSSIK